MTDPINHLRELMAKLDRWDGITMNADMDEEYDAWVEEYREAVDRALPALLAVAEAARGVEESLAVIDEMNHPVLSGVVNGAFIGTRKQLKDALAKLDEVKPS